MKKLVRLLAAISLITIGSARALFRGDLNQVDPNTKNIANRETRSAQAHNSSADPVDNYHQQLIYSINKSITALKNLPASQVTNAGQQISIGSAIAHLEKAREQAMLANGKHHQEASTRIPHTNDQVDFHHARLMEELKKAEQHVSNLGYVDMKRRSDIIQDILDATKAATNANRAHHDQMPQN
jgi:hypothetical protein